LLILCVCYEYKVYFYNEINKLLINSKCFSYIFVANRTFRRLLEPTLNAKRMITMCTEQKGFLIIMKNLQKTNGALLFLALMSIPGNPGKFVGRKWLFRKSFLNFLLNLLLRPSNITRAKNITHLHLFIRLILIHLLNRIKYIGLILVI
jgi:hypothetical protein